MRISELVATKFIVGWQQSSAYVSEVWVGLFTTLAYSATYIILLDFIFNRVNSIAGYSRAEMYFLFWTGQLAFFCLGLWSFDSNREMIRKVNTGNLDFTLLRPVSPLWNIATDRIRVLDGGLRLLFVLPVYGVFVDWSALQFSLAGVVAGVVILAIGIFIEHVLHFLMSATVFWYGEAEQLQYLIYGLSTQLVPFEGMPGWFKTIFTAILPTYITSSIVASAMLGKSNPWMLLGYVVGVGLVFYSIKMLVWKAALRQYSSASS